MDLISTSPTRILFVLVATVIVSFAVFYHGVEKVYSQDPLFDPNDVPQGQPLVDDQPFEDAGMSENQSTDEFSTPGFDDNDTSSGGDSSFGDGSSMDTGGGGGGAGGGAGSGTDDAGGD